MRNGERPQLPSGWEWKTVEQIADCKLGKMLDKQKNVGEPRPYLRNINVQWGRIDLDDVQLMPIQDSEVERFGAAPADLLMCEGGEPGRCAVWTEERPMFLQKALHRIRPYDGVLSEYLRYYFEHIATGGLLEAFVTGTTIKHLPGVKLRVIPVPVPPIGEQRKIIESIEGLEEALNTGTPHLQAAEVRLRLLRAASYADAFSGGSGGLAQIGEETLESVATIQSGIAKGRPGDGATSEVPYLRTANVQAGFLDLEVIKTIAVTPDQRERHLLRHGDVLVLEGGDADKVGRGCLWEGQIGECLHQNHVFAVRPGERLCSRFLARYINAPVARTYFLSVAKQTTNLASINKTNLKALPVPMFSLEDQDRLIDDLDQMLESADQMQAAIEAAKSQLFEVRRSALHRAFRGELTELGRLHIAA